MNEELRYIFSGHESFPCKTLWLKKGYDFVCNDGNFNAPDAVVRLGVGKNMVSSIRYWLKVFGLLSGEDLTEVAHSIFSSQIGYDPYIEAEGTLWLLHYLLVSTKEATLYYLLFCRFQRERLTFERHHILSFVKRSMTEAGRLKAYNENTLRKDASILLQNYTHTKAHSAEDYSFLLTDLDLLRSIDTAQYSFNLEGKRSLPIEILFYAIVSESKGNYTIDYDILQSIGLIFCIHDLELIAMLLALQEKYPTDIRYSDTAGLRQIQLLRDINPQDILKRYYEDEAI